MKMNIRGMYCIIFCCTGSMPGEGGVRRACQNWVAPMIRGSGLTGKAQQDGDGIGLRQVAGPEEAGAAQFDGALEHLIKADEHRDLEEDGQAARSGLTLCSFMNSISFWFIFRGSSLYFSCSAFIWGCKDCIRFIDRVLAWVSGQNRSLMTMVIPMMARP